MIDNKYKESSPAPAKPQPQSLPQWYGTMFFGMVTLWIGALVALASILGWLGFGLGLVVSGLSFMLFSARQIKADAKKGGPR